MVPPWERLQAPSEGLACRASLWNSDLHFQEPDFRPDLFHPCQPAFPSSPCILFPGIIKHGGPPRAFQLVPEESEITTVFKTPRSSQKFRLPVRAPSAVSVVERLTTIWWNK